MWQSLNKPEPLFSYQTPPPGGAAKTVVSLVFAQWTRQGSSSKFFLHCCVDFASVVPPRAVSCKFDRILQFWSNHAVNGPYSFSFLSKFEIQACPSSGKRLGCTAALYMVLLFVLCMHSAKNLSRIFNWVLRSESLSYHIERIDW